ncbi:MAG: M16 family metallopeptidase [Elusimicrobiota bacterium]
MERNLIPVTSFTLSNGLIVAVNTDKTSPVVGVSITYKVGSQCEAPGFSGFAHLFEHLMAQGTKSLKPRELSSLIESNGGTRNAYTTRTNTTYHAVVPKSALKILLWAKAEQMSALDIDARALALEKQVVLEEKRQNYDNRPYAQALTSGLAETVYSNWANRHATIGSSDDVRNARLEDARAFYQAHYAPNNAALALSGDIAPEEARELAERFFGHLKSRTIAPKPDLSEPQLQGEKRRAIADKFAKIPLLAIAWQAPDRGVKDYWALTVFAEILGAGEESPLYKTLVKDTRQTLDAGVKFPWWTSHINPGGPDLFGLYMSLKAGASVDGVIGSVDAVLARLADQGPLKDDIASAKACLELSWISQIEHLGDRATLLSSYAALVGDPAGLKRDMEDMLSITEQDVREALNRWIIGRGRAVIEVYPDPNLPDDQEIQTTPIPNALARGPGYPRPEIDLQRPGPMPALERFALSNGLKVVAARDSRLPLLEARLTIPIGRVAERLGEEGLSGAVSELLLQGADDRDARQISAAIARLGYQVSIGRGLESFSVGIKGLSRNADSFFRVLADVLRGASYPEDEVALWRENKAQELKALRAQPDFLSGERLKSELFAGHPYGRPALDDGELALIVREKIIAFHRRVLSPQGATLAIVGDADPAVLRGRLEAAFVRWTAPAALFEIPPLPSLRPSPLALVDRAGSKQANITIAQAMDINRKDPEWLALAILNQILGGSPTSRLFLNLRVDKGYTYGSSSSLTPLARGTIFMATANVRSEVARPALDEMRTEIARIKDELVPEETIAMVKRHQGGLFLIGNSSIGDMADILDFYEKNGLRAEREMATFLERLDALTPEDIRRVARRCINAEKMTAIVVGDEKTLREQDAKWGLSGPAERL